MKDENTKASVDDAELTRHAAIEQAFVNNYPQLQSNVYTEWPDLTVFGCEQIMTALADNLHRYRRPSGEGFIRWATAWVRREARRHQFLAKIHREYRELVFAAVSRGLYGSPAEDVAIEPCDNEADIFLHLLQHPRKIDALMVPGKAKTSTRLYALMKSRMRGFRRKLNSRRSILVDRLTEGDELGCEYATSPEEIAEISSVA